MCENDEIIIGFLFCAALLALHCSQCRSFRDVLAISLFFLNSLVKVYSVSYTVRGAHVALKAWKLFNVYPHPSLNTTKYLECILFMYPTPSLPAAVFISVMPVTQSAY